MRHLLKLSIFTAAIIVCSMAIGSVQAKDTKDARTFTVKIGIRPGHFRWRGPKDTDEHEASTPVTAISNVPVRDLQTLKEVLKARSKELEVSNAGFLAAYTAGAASYAASHTSHSSDHHVNHNVRHSGTVQHNGSVQQPQQRCGTYNCRCGTDRDVYQVRSTNHLRYYCPTQQNWVYSYSNLWMWNSYRSYPYYSSYYSR